jgi:hypothetical protein
MFGFMIEGERTDLDKVRIPGILGDAQVVIALLLLIKSATAVADAVFPATCLFRALSEDVTWEC